MNIQNLLRIIAAMMIVLLIIIVILAVCLYFCSLEVKECSSFMCYMQPLVLSL